MSDIEIVERLRKPTNPIKWLSNSHFASESVCDMLTAADTIEELVKALGPFAASYRKDEPDENYAFAVWETTPKMLVLVGDMRNAAAVLAKLRVKS